MDSKTIHCQTCQNNVPYFPDMLQGGLSCPHCGAHLIGPSSAPKHDQPRRDDIKKADDGLMPKAPIPKADFGPDASRRRYEDEPEKPSSNAWIWVVVGVVGFSLLLCVGVPIALLLPAVSRVREASARMRSSNNMKQIALAIHNYQDANNHLPDNIRDETGKPILSWRVRLLPYLEQDHIYRMANLKEPWDSPHNKQVFAVTPKVYVIPGREKEGNEGLTFYRGFSGPGTLFDIDRRGRLTFGDITDGTSNTIAVVEAGTAVPWAKPDDLPYSATEPLPKLGGHFKSGYNVILLDGSVRFLMSNHPEQSLRGGIVINDNKFLD